MSTEKTSKLKKLRMTGEERKWLTRNVGKKVELFAVTDAKDKKGMERVEQAWQALEGKLTADELPFEGETSDVTLSRQEVRLVQELVIEVLGRISIKTIPQYQERIQRNPDQEERLQTYLDAAIDLMQGLKSLAKKIGELL
jgi:hypothetical protein